MAAGALLVFTQQVIKVHFCFSSLNLNLTSIICTVFAAASTFIKIETMNRG
jgi:hypothetical protein